MHKNTQEEELYESRSDTKKACEICVFYTERSVLIYYPAV